MSSTSRRGKLSGFLVTIALLAVAAPVSARADGPVVEPGYDMFTTLSGTRIALDVDGPGGAGETVMQFSSEPLGTFDFGSGPQDVGAADTVVRRFEAATPSDGLVPVELLALQLKSVEPVGYWATLQNDRGRHPLDPPDALASPGVIDIGFDPDGAGGTFHVEFLVNYDIRQGSADGPIVALGSTRIQGDDRWQAAAPEEPQVTCHSAGGPAPVHQHCVVSVAGDSAMLVCGETVSPIPAIPGVNSMLNGEDESSDFHPGHSTASSECGTGSGNTCELHSRSDSVTSTAGQQNGTLSGQFTSADPGQQVTLGCTIQIDAPTHAGADEVAESATGTGTATVVEQVTYQLAEGETVYVCTQVTFDGPTVYYYDAPSGEFSTSNTATCASSPVGRAPTAPGTGVLCGFSSSPDATAEGGTQIGTLDGGPYSIADSDDPSVVYEGHLTCTIQVGGGNGTHTATDSVTVIGPTTENVVSVARTQISYLAESTDPVYLCSKVTVVGVGTFYWASTNDPAAPGNWSTSPGVECLLAISSGDSRAAFAERPSSGLPY